MRSSVRVEKDPTEKGDRMLLNFGHTLGHAIEKLKNFELLHGECVALGALAAMKLSENRGMIKPEETNRFKKALGEFHIGTQVFGLEKDAIVAASKSDKKMDSGIIKFILLHSMRHVRGSHGNRGRDETGTQSGAGIIAGKESGA